PVARHSVPGDIGAGAHHYRAPSPRYNAPLQLPHGGRQYVNPIDFAIIIVALVIGGYSGFLYGRQQNRLRHEQEMSALKEQAEARLLDMQEKQRLALVEARDETAKVRTSIETDARERRQEIKRQEQRLQQKEESFDRKVDNLERQERALAQRNQELEERLAGIDALRDQRTADLQRVARMTIDEARAELISSIEESARREASIRAREIEIRAREEAESKAREIITLAVQRCASDQVSDITVSVVPLPNDDMKGRIIGREGRNIRALESATGADIVIDDTPEAVILTGFDPVRREIARVALTKLILDGRIHPARIEEMVIKARQEIDQVILEEGERACIEANVSNLPLDL